MHLEWAYCQQLLAWDAVAELKEGPRPGLIDTKRITMLQMSPNPTRTGESRLHATVAFEVLGREMERARTPAFETSLR